MYIQFYTEELSAEAALRALVPRIVPDSVDFDILVFQGKADLLTNVPSRLRALAGWMPDDWRVVVLVDRDDDDCMALKQHLDQSAHQAGFVSRANATDQQRVQVLNRIAIEELEAWFFGDIAALRTVYPRLSATLGQRERYRDPDAIVGGTWEQLERELRRAGYHRGGLSKILLAREVAPHLDPSRNRSRSFQAFYRGLQELTEIRA